MFRRVRVIISSADKRKRYHVGDDISFTWGKYLDLKGNFHKNHASGYLNFCVADPFIGNTCVESLDHLYNEYIRMYWKFPPGN